MCQLNFVTIHLKMASNVKTVCSEHNSFVRVPQFYFFLFLHIFFYSCLLVVAKIFATKSLKFLCSVKMCQLNFVSIYLKTATNVKTAHSESNCFKRVAQFYWFIFFGASYIFLLLIFAIAIMFTANYLTILCAVNMLRINFILIFFEWLLMLKLFIQNKKIKRFAQFHSFLLLLLFFYSCYLPTI